uniref:uncharacterized protein n=1 Tax=Myxine glutinosa TaxID=7769 RepID=UPI00358EB737
MKINGINVEGKRPEDVAQMISTLETINLLVVTKETYHCHKICNIPLTTLHWKESVLQPVPKAADKKEKQDNSANIMKSASIHSLDLEESNFTAEYFALSEERDQPSTKKESVLQPVPKAADKKEKQDNSANIMKSASIHSLDLEESNFTAEYFALSEERDQPSTKKESVLQPVPKAADKKEKEDDSANIMKSASIHSLDLEKSNFTAEHFALSEERDEPSTKKAEFLSTPSVRRPWLGVGTSLTSHDSSAMDICDSLGLTQSVNFPTRMPTGTVFKQPSIIWTRLPPLPPLTSTHPGNSSKVEKFLPTLDSDLQLDLTASAHGS